MKYKYFGNSSSTSTLAEIKKELKNNSTLCVLFNLHSMSQSESQTIYHFRGNFHKGTFPVLIFKEESKDQELIVTVCTTSTLRHTKCTNLPVAVTSRLKIAIKSFLIMSGDNKTVLRTVQLTLQRNVHVNVDHSQITKASRLGQERQQCWHTAPK